MSKTSDKQQQLVATLKELFMMDQADLDFGIYRIMNAKHTEIESFLNNDLLPTIRGTLQAGGKASDTQKELNELVKTLQDAGMNPDESPKVKELKALLGNGANNSLEKDEAEIFSQLTTFFSRYYDGGDFMSLRRYKQETYSPLPMNGEEVKLHWANADQYYIKSAESFSNYAFKIGDGDKKKTIRFELVQASTEQNNKKEASDKERRFILDENQPISLRQVEDREELILHFNYQADSEKRKQKDLNLAAIEFIRKCSSESLGEGFNNWQSWQAELLAPKPTDKNKNRTVLEKYLMDYTAKNSFDYFIHKDLGGFLKRELDFFIKNELLLLDDIVPDSTDALASQLLSNERSLKKVVAFKGIALKLIAFLAQLENFQRKLWLKKKFILESHYCMTLDRVPEVFYEEILACEGQLREWESLGFTTEYTKYTESFLKENPFLVIDTGLFGEDFKQRLLAEIEDLDEMTDGLLVHSENFQALNLMQERYREQVKCVYIDPPYNTGGDDFVYKDGYIHSTWGAMLLDRVKASTNFLNSSGAYFQNIDDREQPFSRYILDECFDQSNFVANIIWQKNYAVSNNTKGIGSMVDHLLCYQKSSNFRVKLFPRTDTAKSRYINPDNDPRGPWKPVDYWNQVSPIERPNLSYTITNPHTKQEIVPSKKAWKYSHDTYQKHIDENRIYWGKDGKNTVPTLKRFLSEVRDGVVPSNFWSHEFAGHTDSAKKGLEALMGPMPSQTPKPTKLIERVCSLVFENNKDTEYVLDYFAGSGTTAHATINLNREDNGSRKYILVEMGDYLNTVIVPRIKKVIFSKNWKNAKPVVGKDDNYNGISHCFKYIRLESYEDVVDNLQLQRTESQADLLNNPDNKTLKEDYLLNYMLDIEAKGSLFSRDLFVDPFNTKIRVVRDNESREQRLDLVDTFNYLLGLKVESTRKQQGMVEVIGINPADESVHIIWRNLKETDNDALDKWFRKQSYNTRDMEFDRVYVNGDNNLPNLKTSEESWKVQLIEEAFETLMFDCQDV